MVLQSCPALRQWGQAFLFPILKDQSMDRCSSGDSMQCWVILSGWEWVPSWDSALNHQPPTLSAAGASASHTTVSTALPNTTYLKSRAFSTVSSELEFLGKDIYAACTVHKIKFPLSYDFVKLDVQIGNIHTLTQEDILRCYFHLQRLPLLRLDYVSHRVYWLSWNFWFLIAMKLGVFESIQHPPPTTPTCSPTDN